MVVVSQLSEDRAEENYQRWLQREGMGAARDPQEAAETHPLHPLDCPSYCHPSLALHAESVTEEKKKKKKKKKKKMQVIKS